MSEHAQDGLAYATVISTFLGGVMHLSWWCAGLGIAMLMLLHIPGQGITTTEGLQRVLSGSRAIHFVSGLVSAAMIGAGVFFLGDLAAWLCSF